MERQWPELTLPDPEKPKTAVSAGQKIPLSMRVEGTGLLTCSRPPAAVLGAAEPFSWCPLAAIARSECSVSIRDERFQTAVESGR